MRVVLLWHMHQPEYRVNGAFRRSWAYLHALAAYTDMAAQLEAAPRMRVVVNFTPVLLDQLDDYARRLQRWKRDGLAVGDPLLDALIEPPGAGSARAGIVRSCLSAQGSRRAARYPHYVELAAAATQWAAGELPDTLFVDLLVWFHLLWLGETLRIENPKCAVLIDRGRDYGSAERHELLGVIAGALERLIPRWRALADEGRVELALSPYYHPLMPLMLDFGSARDRAPELPLPATQYPDGEARMRWHLAEGLRRFESCFGRRPSGCWPPEAAVSDAALRLIADAGLAWTASSQAVLSATLAAKDGGRRDPHRLFRAGAAGIGCAFRDDGLSDRIGFAYQHWQAGDAVADLLAQLEQIAREPGREFLLIALDGENPWEFYPDDGAQFLNGLYQALCEHPVLQPATMMDCLRELAGPLPELPSLCAGSWVHGELLTWVGHPEKNHAWEILMEARRHFDRPAKVNQALLHQLGACEGSDWFWWPGAKNPAPAVRDFDELFRAQLSALYAGLGLPAPELLSRPFAAGVEHAVAAGGTMQPGA